MSDADTQLVKHSLLLAGHRTSISLEGVFWRALRAEATRRGLSVAALVGVIDEARGTANLSSALRVFLMQAAQRRADHEGADQPATVDGSA